MCRGEDITLENTHAADTQKGSDRVDRAIDRSRRSQVGRRRKRLNTNIRFKLNRIQYVFMFHISDTRANKRHGRKRSNCPIWKVPLTEQRK